VDTTLLRSSTISEIVEHQPGVIPVLESFQIDYCCNAARSFGEACRDAKVNEDEVLGALMQSPGAAIGTIRAENWSLDLLSNYIIQNHHQYVKRSLPEIQAVLEKVLLKHGANHPELGQIRDQFMVLQKELQTHMYHEEHVLFPAINALVRESSRLLPVENLAHSMSNLDPVVVDLKTEHQQVGDCLRCLRSISNNYALPPDACKSFTSLYQRLQEFEADMHLHVHLENNLLFPKALSLQARQQEKPLYVN